jgi:hypothetical protein
LSPAATDSARDSASEEFDEPTPAEIVDATQHFPHPIARPIVRHAKLAASDQYGRRDEIGAARDGFGGG